MWKITGPDCILLPSTHSIHQSSALPACPLHPLAGAPFPFRPTLGAQDFDIFLGILEHPV